MRSRISPAGRLALTLLGSSTAAIAAVLFPRSQGGWIPAGLLFLVLTAGWLRRWTAPSTR